MGKGRRESGVSLIEAMIAAAMLASAAITVYPIVFQSKTISQHSDFHTLCLNAVRAKINEYRFGQSTAMAGAMTMSTVANGLNVATGFAYAKWRYNAQNLAYCPRDPAWTQAVPTSLNVPMTPMPPANLADLGREECIVGRGVAFPCAGAGDSLIDRQMQQRTLNRFRMYVNLRRYNPMMGAEDCMWYPATNSYDFQHAGDMIKITATGVVDLLPGQSIAGVAANGGRRRELTCQMTDVLRPFTQVARYWLQEDGRIFRWGGTGITGAAEVLTNLASPGNLGIAVSPDNRFAFVLRSGKIIRFMNCGDDPLQCPTAGQLEWNIPANVVSMAVLFRPITGAPHRPVRTCGTPTDGHPIIFGLLSDHRTSFCFDTNEVPVPIAGGQALTARPDNWPDAGGNVTRIPYVLPVAPMRIHSIFMDPAGTSTYVVDVSSSTFLNNTTYHGGVYNSSDVNLTYPLEGFNVRGIAFSK